MHTANRASAAEALAFKEVPDEILTNTFDFEEPDKKVEPIPYVRKVSPLAPGEVFTLRKADYLQARDYPDRAKLDPPQLSIERGGLTFEDWGSIVDAIGEALECMEQISDLPGYEALQASSEAVGRGELKCPVCEGWGSTPLLYRSLGSRMLIRIRKGQCPCATFKTLWRELGNPANLPKLFQGITLAGLQPSDLSVLPAERQQKIISYLQAKPDDSYFLFGPPGTGKTHMISGLYRHGVEQWAPQATKQFDGVQACWRIKTATLLDQCVTWATRSGDDGAPTKYPAVTIERIQSALAKGYRPRLYLDEIDKFPFSDYKIGILGGVVDCIWENGGQVCATSNLGIDELTAKWGKSDAGTILRRIGAGPSAHTIQFE
jgi:hypothetical protein